MFSLKKTKLNCLYSYWFFSKLVTQFVKFGKKERIENYLYIIIKLIKLHNFIGVRHFKAVTFLQYVLFFIKPKVAFTKFVKKFKKKKLRKRLKAGSTAALLDYLRRLSIFPKSIKISKS
jgi:hypothetical protein